MKRKLMNNNFNKKPVFLIDLIRDEDYALFYEELGERGLEAPEKKLSRHMFSVGQGSQERNARRRYLCISLFGPWMFWSGDSELRPLGRFTSEYVPIGGRAITIGHYFDILAAMDKEDDVPEPQQGSFYVEMDENVRSILSKEGYEGWHRPYFAMMGHTHSVYNLCPYEQVYHDSAPDNAEFIPAAEFVSMYKSTYEPCEPMDFCDYKNYIDEGEKKGIIVEPELDDTVNGLYYYTDENQPKDIIRIPKNTLCIMPKTFKKCGYATDVIFPEGLMTIERDAFFDCWRLRRIYMPRSVKQIHHGAFNNCYNLVEIYYEGSEEEWKALCGNDISDKKRQKESGIAKTGNEKLMRATVYFDCKM